MEIFQSWQGLGRIAVTAVIVYVAIVIFVNLSGKRATSKMNNFDWVVTVGLGSMAASIVLSKEVVLLEGIFAIAFFLGLQYFTTLMVSRFTAIEKLIKLQPKLLFYNGQFLKREMKAERVSKNEILAAIRGTGLSSTESVRAVIMESNADISVISKEEEQDYSALTPVKLPD